MEFVMNFFHLSMITGLVALAAVSSADAGHDECDRCHYSSVASTERCLKDIRGSVRLGILEDEETFQCTADRGNDTFWVSNFTSERRDITELLRRIFQSEVEAAAQFTRSFDVHFKCPLHSDPSVVLTLENFDPPESNGVIVNSYAVVVRDVTPHGFTVNINYTLYGRGDLDITLYNILLFLRPGLAVDFIAQGR
jgi:hypothetical protein